MVFCCSQAAKLIMLGFDMIAIPPLQEAFDIVKDDSAVEFHDWLELEEQFGLDPDQLSWVTELARFKSSYRLVNLAQCSCDCSLC